MVRRSIAAAAALLALVSAACADPADTGAGSRSTTPSTDPATDPGAATLVLRVSTEGGFTPVDYQLTNMPTFSLYEDGTIVTTGPMIEIYPPPALPSLQSQTVDGAGVDAIVAAAIDAGLDTAGDLTDMGSVAIADAPDTVFTLHADGVDTTVRVYALTALQDRPPTMSKEEWEARVALNGLAEDLMDLPSWLPDGSLQGEPVPYAAAGARVYVTEYRGEQDLAQSPVAWPLEPSLASFGLDDAMSGYRCGTVTGEDWTQALEPLAEGANQLTPWTSDGQRWSLRFRPLLPDERGC
jgi:hypothetical protein